MKRLTLILHTFALALTVGLSAPTLAESNPRHIYLNENLGFNVEGYNYTQAEFPCDLDKVLVEQIVRRGKRQGLTIEPVTAAEILKNAERPVLAIDIDALVLNENFAFGTRSHSNLPSVRITAALIRDQSPEGFTTAKHSCAIATLNELTPSSSVLDMGTYGKTVCSVTHRCLRDLGRDIVQWVEPQL